MINIYVIVGCILSITVITATDKEWVEPDAWSLDYSKTLNQLYGAVRGESKDSTNQRSKCEVSQNVNDVISEVYYRKLLVLLFHKSKLKYDSKNKIYKRTFEMSLSADDIKVLETSTDPRDWDEVASKIITNAKSSIVDETEGSTFIFTLSKIWGYLSNSEVRFALIVLLVVVLIISLHKMYNYRIITIILIALSIYGYFYTYLDCNKKMELENLVENLDGQSNNPCGTQKSFFSFWSSSMSKQMCLEHLQKKHRKFFYCRPDDVFLIYINDILLKQFQFMVEKCMEVCEKYSRKLSFPYNYIAMFSIPFLLIMFLKEIFRNILNPFNWRRFSNHSHKDREFIESTTKDNLSGNNLKLFLSALQNQPQLKEGDNFELGRNSCVENLQCLTAPVQNTPFFDSKQKAKNSTKNGSKSDLSDSSVEIIDNFY